MIRVLLWLPLAVLVAACLALNLAARRRRWRSADPPWWWKPWLAPWFALHNWWHRPRPVRLPRTERAERLATGTDVRGVLPLTPLPPPDRRPAQAPRIVPDVPEACWCGKPRWHLPDYVITALHHPTVAETLEADSLVMPAVTR